MVKSVTVRAPCSTANLGPGFDVFGLALDAFYDEVTVTKKGKGITIVSSDDIPLDPKKNTAGLVGKAMMKDFVKRGIKYKNGIEVKIKKGVPAGYGVGSSAASAAACAIGINELFGEVFEDWELINYAGIGEKASAGTVHYDNVAASIIGGFVVVNPYDEQEIKFGGIQVIGFGTLIFGIPRIILRAGGPKPITCIPPNLISCSSYGLTTTNPPIIDAATLS
jgi:homoserine kinase